MFKRFGFFRLEEATPETPEAGDQTPFADDGQSVMNQVDDGQQQAEPQVDAEANNTKEPIYRGLTGELRTPEELAEYTKNLETKLIESQMQKDNQDKKTENDTTLSNLDTKTPVNLDMTPEETDKIYEDPQGFVKDLTNKIMSNIEENNQKSQRKAQFWSEFYEKNPDLQNHREAVELITQGQLASIANVPLSEARDIIANKSRAFIDKTRKAATGQRETMENSSTTTFSSSGTGEKATKQQPVRKSFAEQMKEFQRK